jgi:transcriptional regulator with XRE-family HTH domain
VANKVPRSFDRGHKVRRPGSPSWVAAFAAVVHAARGRKGLSQAETARRLGLALAVYSRIERGLLVPGVKRLRVLCRVLDVSPDDLLVLEYGAPPPLSKRQRRPRPALADTPAIRGLLDQVAQLTPEQLRRFNQIAALLFP